MRIGRALIIPAIVVFGTAGSGLAGTVIPAAATSIAAIRVQHGAGMHDHGALLADPATDPSGGSSGVSTGTNMYHHT
jgi:hypothetical protein